MFPNNAKTALSPNPEVALMAYYMQQQEAWDESWYVSSKNTEDKRFSKNSFSQSTVKPTQSQMLSKETQQRSLNKKKSWAVQETFLLSLKLKSSFKIFLHSYVIKRIVICVTCVCIFFVRSHRFLFALDAIDIQCLVYLNLCANELTYNNNISTPFTWKRVNFK